jgi:hypothetical protein
MAAKAKIYQFKITLKGIRPPIWRRFEVSSAITFLDLHHIIQEVMGWENAHLHQFFVDGHNLTDRTTLEEVGYGGADVAKTRLDKFVQQEGQKFVYEYDFGDSWEHELLLEKILEPEAGASYPRCLKGKRACPPEDCGGFWGYQMLLEVLQDPEHPEHDDLLEWVDEEFDPEAFDLAGVNQMLARPQSG